MRGVAVDENSCVIKSVCLSSMDTESVPAIVRYWPTEEYPTSPIANHGGGVVKSIALTALLLLCVICDELAVLTSRFVFFQKSKHDFQRGCI